MRKFEIEVSSSLRANGYGWRFEEHYWMSKVKVRGNVCLECSAPMVKLERYTPDFVLPGREPKVIIEAKGGTFTRSSQARIKRFFKQHGEDVEYVIVAKSNVRLKNLKGNPTLCEWGDKWNIPVVIGVDNLIHYLGEILD